MDDWIEYIQRYVWLFVKFFLAAMVLVFLTTLFFPNILGLSYLEVKSTLTGFSANPEWTSPFIRYQANFLGIPWIIACIIAVSRWVRENNGTMPESWFWRFVGIFSVTSFALSFFIPFGWIAVCWGFAVVFTLHVYGDRWLIGRTPIVLGSSLGMPIGVGFHADFLLSSLTLAFFLPYGGLIALMLGRVPVLQERPQKKR